MYLFFDELAICLHWSALFCATGVWGAKPIGRVRVKRERKIGITWRFDRDHLFPGSETVWFDSRDQNWPRPDFIADLKNLYRSLSLSYRSIVGFVKIFSESYYQRMADFYRDYMLPGIPGHISLADGAMNKYVL